VFFFGLVPTAIGVELPMITPQVSSVFPHGAKRGTDVEIELRGSNLDGAREIRFDDPGIKGRIQDSSFRQTRARIRIEPSVETGRHEFRLIKRVHGSVFSGWVR